MGLPFILLEFNRAAAGESPIKTGVLQIILKSRIHDQIAFAVFPRVGDGLDLIPSLPSSRRTPHLDQPINVTDGPARIERSRKGDQSSPYLSGRVGFAVTDQ